jgi:hypothetical protein
VHRLPWRVEVVTHLLTIHNVMYKYIMPYYIELVHHRNGSHIFGVCVSHCSVDTSITWLGLLKGVMSNIAYVIPFSIYHIATWWLPLEHLCTRCTLTRLKCKQSMDPFYYECEGSDMVHNYVCVLSTRVPLSPTLHICVVYWGSHI